jgi:hypothetical protein
MNTPSTIAATTTTEPNVQEETTATASAPGEEEMQLVCPLPSLFYLCKNDHKIKAVEESITADPLPTEIVFFSFLTKSFFFEVATNGDSFGN